MTTNLERIKVLASRGWMSPRQFAGLIGVTYDTMLVMIDKGNVKAIQVGKHYRIYQDEIERFMREGNALDVSAASTPPNNENEED